MRIKIPFWRRLDIWNIKKFRCTKLVSFFGLAAVDEFCELVGNLGLFLVWTLLINPANFWVTLAYFAARISDWKMNECMNSVGYHRAKWAMVSLYIMSSNCAISDCKNEKLLTPIKVVTMQREHDNIPLQYNARQRYSSVFIDNKTVHSVRGT